LAVALHACWAYLGFVSEGRDWYKQALAAAGTAHTVPRAEALKNDGILAWLAHDYPAGIASAAAAVELARALEADSLRVLALRALALNAEALGDSVRAREALEEALTLARAIDDQRGLAYVLECLGAMAVNDGNQTTAREWLTEGLSVARAASVNSEAATIVRHLGWCALLDGDVGEAQDHFREALVLSVELNHATLIALTFVGIAVSAGLAGNSMRAARLLGVWDELSGRFGISVPPRQQATVDRVRETLLGVLGPGELGTALADGRALTLAEAITYALEETTSDIQPRQPA
jgi:non-specific serine/threonine protein kinase